MGYMIGIVGKPNAGKSTFFAAATLANVPIANYPFTTIKPNHGIGYVRTHCVCREFNVRDQPVNSICIDGSRLIPVELIDCAGLVPGAWQGRGLGNQFLDEVRKADVLIHVVDASGSTDIEGKVCQPGDHDPNEDVKFLENELDMWTLQIVKKDWEKLAKRTEGSKDSFVEQLESRLSGLSISKAHILGALTRSSVDGAKGSTWNEEALKLFLHNLRGIAKPMMIAANKIDLPYAEKNVEALKGTGYHAVPCCAEAELALRRASEKGFIEYVPGDSNFRILKLEGLINAQREALEVIREKILLPWGSTGVQGCLDQAYLKLLGMIVVYPVTDVDRLTDHQGRVLPDAYLVPYGTTAKDFAFRLHSELGESFIYAIEVRSKMRVGEDYRLKDRDVISIVSAKKRG